jgi:hypothetical protein
MLQGTLIYVVTQGQQYINSRYCRLSVMSVKTCSFRYATRCHACFAELIVMKVSQCMYYEYPTTMRLEPIEQWASCRNILGRMQQGQMRATLIT